MSVIEPIEHMMLLEANLQAEINEIEEKKSQFDLIADKDKHARNNSRLLQFQLRGKRHRLGELRKQIKRAKVGHRRTFDRDAAFVTDHAVIRFLERVHGLDMDAVRRATLRWLEEVGTGRAIISPDGVVVTILPEGSISDGRGITGVVITPEVKRKGIVNPPAVPYQPAIHRLEKPLHEMPAGPVAKPPHSTKPKAVIAPDGRRFASLTDAGRAEGVTNVAIRKRIQRGVPGWRFADEARP